MWGLNWGTVGLSDRGKESFWAPRGLPTKRRNLFHLPKWRPRASMLEREDQSFPKFILVRELIKPEVQQDT